MKKYKKFLACIALIGCMQECRAEYAFASSGSAITGSSMATIASGKKGWAFAANLTSPTVIHAISALVGVITLLQPASHYENSPHKVAWLARAKKANLLTHLEKDIDGMQDRNDSAKSKDPFIDERQRAVKKDIADYTKLLKQYPSEAINQFVNGLSWMTLAPYILDICGVFKQSENTAKVAGVSASLAAGLQLYNTWNSRKTCFKILEMKDQDDFLEAQNMKRAQTCFNIQKADHSTYYPRHGAQSECDKLHEQGGYVVPSNDDDINEGYAWHLTRKNLKTSATYDWTKQYYGLPEITYVHKFYHPEGVAKAKTKSGTWENCRHYC